MPEGDPGRPFTAVKVTPLPLGSAKPSTGVEVPSLPMSLLPFSVETCSQARPSGRTCGEPAPTVVKTRSVLSKVPRVLLATSWKW